MGMEKSGNSNKCFEKESSSHPLRMSQEELVEKIKKILNRDVELAFLFNLDLQDLKILLASLRDLIEREMQRV
jgi:hypothetical protein